ncbi:hypothetical protein Trydic_g5348 [Trypoxylus dichotomus]
MVRASGSPSKFWRAVKILKRQRVPAPPIHGVRGVAFTTEDKAEAFAETLERQCSPIYENVDVNRIGRIHRRVRDFLTAEEDKESIRPTSPEEVKAIVKSFRSNRAPGPDGITYRALKHAPRKFVMHMTNICNAMLRLRHFPSQWKQAGVAMIRKPGQPPHWPQNYRPISLLPVTGNIADRIILTRLREETDDFDVIPNCHFGCIEPASPRQWTDSYTPFSAGGPSRSSWKDSGPQRGQVQQEYRNPCCSVSTPDIPTNAHVNLAMYADDGCIFSRTGTQSGELPSIPIEKTTAVLFSIGGRRRRRHGNPAKLTCRGGIIPWQQQVKYLGVTLDSRVNWVAHIHRVPDRGRQMLGTLNPLMVRREKLDPSSPHPPCGQPLRPHTSGNSKRSRIGHCIGPSTLPGS